MNVTERFKRKVNLVDYIGKYTTLRKAGNTYRGLCPIHGSKESETICVYPEQEDYFCYSCGSGGNIINFVADMNKTSYENAIEILANEFNINIKNDKQYQQESKRNYGMTH